MKESKPRPAPPSQEAVAGRIGARALHQRWRERWDAMPLAGQFRTVLLAAVMLTVLAAGLVVVSCQVAVAYFESRAQANRVTAAVLGHQAESGDGDILAGVQAQPAVVAAAFEQPDGELRWTFDRNAPDESGVIVYGRARTPHEYSVQWYERHRLDQNLHQSLMSVTVDSPLGADIPAELRLMIVTPSVWHVARNALLQVPLILALAVALALLAARRLSKQVAEPLAQLVDVTRIDQFRGVQAQGAPGDNELVRIAQNFHALTAKLTDNEREMREVRLSARKQILEQTRELELRVKKAESVARSKDEFLANMSHEIRTPMNGVLGMAELLAGTSLDRRQRRFVDSMREAAGTMMQIINDILDDSKIEAGKMDLVCEPFEVRDLVEQAAQLYAGRAEIKKIELCCQVEPGVPAVVIGDALRLRQVLGNLLSNAVKYTEHGEIQLRVGIDDLAHDSHCRLLFRVSDTGPGIAPNQQATVFEAFTQLEGGNRVGGTGLGLSIATGLVKLLGGDRIELHSQLGRGSVFSFELPFEIVESAPVADSTEFKGLRALIVDDVSTSYLALQEVLTSWGVEVKVSTNGHTLDDLVSSAARLGAPYDVVLLDHSLPDATPDDLLRAIRVESTVPETYCALLSAFAYEPRKVGDRTVRPDICLPKPVRQQQLRSLLRTARATRDGIDDDVDAGDQPATPAVATSAGLGLTVLVADDNAINRSVAIAMLEQLECAVVVAENGRATVDHARSGRFDVVLMDCQMPVLDGYAATSEIRREEGLDGRARTTIVALTANALTRDRERCLAAGMDAFLAKPFTMAQLAEVLRPVAELRGTLRPPRLAEAPARGIEPVPPNADDDETEPTIEVRELSDTSTMTLLDTGMFVAVAAPAVPVLDGEQVKAIRGLSKPRIFEQLCEMMYVSGPESLRKIGAALEAGDLPAVAEAAHAMKSAVTSLGGRQLAEQLDALEHASVDKPDAEAARRAASGLARSYASFEAALREQATRATGT